MDIEYSYYQLLPARQSINNRIHSGRDQGKLNGRGRRVDLCAGGLLDLRLPVCEPVGDKREGFIDLALRSKERVVAGASGQGIARATLAPDDVVSLLPQHDVLSGSAAERVVAGSTQERIVTGTPIERVAPGLTQQTVVATSSSEHVAAPAFNPWGRVPRNRTDPPPVFLRGPWLSRTRADAVCRFSSENLTAVQWVCAVRWDNQCSRSDLPPRTHTHARGERSSTMIDVNDGRVRELTGRGFRLAGHAYLKQGRLKSDGPLRVVDAYTKKAVGVSSRSLALEVPRLNYRLLWVR